MNNKVFSVRQIILVCLCISTVLCRAQKSLAQLDRISISIDGGAGYVSLKEWEDFYSSISSGHFEKDKFGSFIEFRVAYHPAERHAIAFNVENIRTSATLYGAMALTDPWSDTTGYACYVDEWDFSAIPIGLSYEFYPRGFKGKVSPFLGVGISYFFSQVEAKSYYLNNGVFGDLSSEDIREGEGFGIHLYAGVQSRLTEHLLILSRLRGRYADGMFFTDNKGEIKVDFTGVDFTLGLGWIF